MDMKTRGFTLIELLVVIAIIGLLSSIVLAALNTARGKAKDAAIQSDLDTIRTQAELFRKTDGACYPGITGNCATVSAFTVVNPANSVCTVTTSNTLCSQPGIQRAFAGAMDASGGFGSGGLASFQTPIGAGSYAVAVRLVADKALAWCVDSAGRSLALGTPGGADMTQAAINAFTADSECD